jgi:hypothetical protein
MSLIVTCRLLVDRGRERVGRTRSTMPTSRPDAGAADQLLSVHAFRGIANAIDLRYGGSKCRTLMSPFTP